MDLEKLLLVICIFVLLEALLINTIIKPQWLPGYPKEDMGVLKFETKIMGFYQRPYSIGNNSTITGSLVMILVFYLYSSANKIINVRSKKIFYLAIFTVIAIGSGTAYMLLLAFFVFKVGPFKNLKRALISSTLILAFYYLLFVVDIGSNKGLEKISAYYLTFLVDFKLEQINIAYQDLATLSDQLLIGKKFESASQLIIWSDFAWCDLFYCTGYVGFIFTLIIFIFKTNRYNYIPIVICMIGSLHYAAAYSLPGQLLLGYFMSSKFKNYAQHQVQLVRHKKFLKPISH